MLVQPISLATANSLVAVWHRHSKQVQGHLYSLGLFDDEWGLHGAVIVGRPVARHLDDGHTAEITRLVTDGTPNACSRLYGAACREARKRSYRTMVTYTLTNEPGASLRASGFTPTATVTPRQWNCPSRPRKHRHAAARLRWQKPLTKRKGVNDDLVQS